MQSADLKKVDESLTHAIMLELFTAAHIQFMTKMLIELKKVLSQELKCLFV